MSNVAPLLSRLQVATGVLLVLAGLVLNPWFIESNVVRDGTLEQKGYVLTANALLIALGLILVVRARKVREAIVDSRTVQIALAALGFSVIIAMLLAEVAVRVLLDPQQLFRADEDGWWQLRWQSNQAETAADALTPEAFSFDRYDPDLGWSPKPGFRSADVRTNSKGVRSDREYSPDRTAESLRVVMVGDSFTWGEEVANEDTFASQLETMLPGAEVINLGVHGFGTDQQLLRLKRDGIAYRPDVVMLVFFEGNINRNVLTFRDYGKPRLELLNGELVAMNQPVPTREQYRDYEVPLPLFWIGKLATNAVVRILTATKLYPPLEEWERWSVSRAILIEARRVSEAAGAKFLLGYIADSETREPGELERVIADWAVATGTRYINFSDVFRGLPDDEWDQIYRGHLTPYGNRLAAETIAAVLEAKLVNEPAIGN